MTRTFSGSSSTVLFFRRLVACVCVVFAVLVWTAGAGSAQTSDNADEWSPAPTGDDTWTSLHDVQVPADPRITIDSCPVRARDWQNRDHTALVELQVYSCQTREQAANRAGAFYRNAVALNVSSVFGVGIDFVDKSGPLYCDLERTWTQGNATIVLITASPTLSPARCVDLNETQSRSYSSALPTHRSPYADTGAGIFQTLAQGIPMAMLGIVAFTVLFMTSFRPTFRLPTDRRRFVDVRRLARFAVWITRLWSIVRAIRWTALAFGLYQLYIAVTQWSLLALSGGLGLLVVSRILRPVAQAIKNQDFLHTGAVSYMERVLDGGGRSLLWGSLIRAVARVGAILVFFGYLLLVALLAVVSPHGQLADLERARMAGLGVTQFTGRDLLLSIVLRVWDNVPLLVVPVSLFVLLYGLFLLDRVGAAIHSRRAKHVLAGDKRRHILYLRNFGDDEIKIAATSELSNRGVLAEFNLFRRTSFEESIVQRLNRYGPVIAVSDPNHPMRTLGSAKLSLPNEGWFDVVKDLGGTALAVIVSAAPKQLNDGLRKEIAFIGSELGHDRVMLVLPPAGRRRTLGKRWTRFRDAVSGYPIFDGVEGAVGEAAAQIAVRTARGWVGWGSALRSEASYVVSLNEAMDTVQEQWSAQLSQQHDATPASDVVSDHKTLVESDSVTRAWALAQSVIATTGVQRVGSALLIASLACVESDTRWTRLLPQIGVLELEELSRVEDLRGDTVVMAGGSPLGIPVSGCVSSALRLCSELCASYGVPVAQPGMLAVAVLADPRAGAAAWIGRWTGLPHADVLRQAQSDLLGGELDGLDALLVNHHGAS